VSRQHQRHQLLLLRPVLLLPGVLPRLPVRRLPLQQLHGCCAHCL
jgi:hypothetical protein